MDEDTDVRTELVTELEVKIPCAVEPDERLLVEDV
jgi:hypothetical protein